MDGHHTEHGRGPDGRASGHRAVLRALARQAPVPLSPKLSPEDVLLARGVLSNADLTAARTSPHAPGMTLNDILLARSVVSEVELLSAMAECSGIGVVDLTEQPPDPTLRHVISTRNAIEHGAVPWRRIGSAIVVVMACPDRLDDVRQDMPKGHRIIPALAPREQILFAQTTLYGEDLARRAEGQVAARDSCRNWRPETAARALLLTGLGLGMAAVAFPVAMTALIFGLTLLVFLCNMALKIAAFASTLRANRQRATEGTGTATPLPAAHLHDPVVTILVPLFKEPDVASTLIANLSRIEYPPDRLDVLLAVEADDTTTREALARCSLPPWMRPIVVPPGHPRTKPRALNFALNFARGSIVGIYDAEDRPDPDQIRRIADRFAQVPPKVVCLQGRLDYYNSHFNSLARFFSIEYASWFRVLLPGVQRLGLFVPLGGTTLFLRRRALDEVGGWDAHNVTEDADLGLRLAINGYETEIVETTTYEEANAAVWPWIKQRSRWQKGYLMTWATAMRRPRALWQGLGAWRFLGLQVQVLFAVVGFLVAPLLWSLMVKPFGVAHPLDAVLAPWHYGCLAVLMVASLVLSVAISIYATRAPHLRGNRPWIFISEIYFVLGTFAAWRAVAEVLLRPFFWAKTEHGRFGGAQQPAPVPDQGAPCASS